MDKNSKKKSLEHIEVTTMRWVQNLLNNNSKQSKFHMDRSIHLVFSFDFAKFQPRFNNVNPKNLTSKVDKVGCYFEFHRTL